MTFPFATRAPQPAEVNAIRLMLSTFRDGSGTERDPDGVMRPNWRQMERVIAELFTGGPPPENKAIFDVVAPSLDTANIYYGLSVKSKQLSLKAFSRLHNDSRLYMETANSPAKFFAALYAKHAISEQDVIEQRFPSEVGSCVLETVNDWHREGKVGFEVANPGSILDLEQSIFLCISYRQWSAGTERLFQLHSYPLQFPVVTNWVYRGRALCGYDPQHPAEKLFDWYPFSGGQLKYYPKGSDALYSSAPFTLADSPQKDIYSRAEEYWPDEWQDIQDGLHPSLVGRNL